MWDASLAYSQFDADLRLGGQDTALSERMLAVSLGRRLGERWHASVTAAAILGGDLIAPGASPEVGAGFLGALDGSVRLLDEQRLSPSVQVTLGVAAARTHTQPSPTTERAGLTALDARVGITIGKTLFDRVGVHVAARGFAGPVSWDRQPAVSGGDRHHYQLGAGVSVALPQQLRVFAEWSPFGERAVTAGIGLAFGAKPTPPPPAPAEPSNQIIAWGQTVGQQ